MAFWRRSAGISRNDSGGQSMEVKNVVVFDVITKQLVWYGNFYRMTEEMRLSKNSVPPGRRRRQMIRCSVMTGGFTKNEGMLTP